MHDEAGKIFGPGPVNIEAKRNCHALRSRQEQRTAASKQTTNK